MSSSSEVPKVRRVKKTKTKKEKKEKKQHDPAVEPVEESKPEREVEEEVQVEDEIPPLESDLQNEGVEEDEDGVEEDDDDMDAMAAEDIAVLEKRVKEMHIRMAKLERIAEEKKRAQEGAWVDVPDDPSEDHVDGKKLSILEGFCNPTTHDLQGMYMRMVAMSDGTIQLFVVKIDPREAWEFRGPLPNGLRMPDLIRALDEKDDAKFKAKLQFARTGQGLDRSRMRLVLKPKDGASLALSLVHLSDVEAMSAFLLCLAGQVFQLERAHRRATVKQMLSGPGGGLHSLLARLSSSDE